MLKTGAARLPQPNSINTLQGGAAKAPAANPSGETQPPHPSAARAGTTALSAAGNRSRVWAVERQHSGAELGTRLQLQGMLEELHHSSLVSPVLRQTGSRREQLAPRASWRGLLFQGPGGGSTVPGLGCQRQAVPRRGCFVRTESSPQSRCTHPRLARLSTSLPAAEPCQADLRLTAASQEAFKGPREDPKGKTG